MTAYMYILLCADGTYYTGSTKDLHHRIIQHESGFGAEYTRKRLPVKLVYYEEYDQIELAFQREQQVKKWSHKKKKALVLGKDEELPKLAKKVFRKEKNIS